MTIQDEARGQTRDGGLTTELDTRSARRGGRSGRSSTESSRRAYARRQRRLQKAGDTRLGAPGRPVAAALDRAPFVVAMIALLSGGVAGVLYLNTLTDEAGMKASAARSATSTLRLDIEALQREVAGLDSTPRIAQVAAQLGLTVAGDAAMLEIDGAGHGTVVGTPSAVPAPSPAPAPSPEAAAPTSPAPAAAAATDPAAAAAPSTSEQAAATPTPEQAPAAPPAAAQAPPAAEQAPPPAEQASAPAEQAPTTAEQAPAPADAAAAGAPAATTVQGTILGAQG